MKRVCGVCRLILNVRHRASTEDAICCSFWLYVPNFALASARPAIVNVDNHVNGGMNLGSAMDSCRLQP